MVQDCPRCGPSAQSRTEHAEQSRATPVGVEARVCIECEEVIEVF